jgi:hypothetical protein
MRNNDITDTREKLGTYMRSGLISFSRGSAIPQFQPPAEDPALGE